MPDLLLVCAAVCLAPMLVLALYLGWQSTIRAEPYEVMFEVRQSDPVRVSRSDGGWAVAAPEGMKPATLRVGASFESLGAACPLTPADGLYLAAQECPRQHCCFEIAFEDGRTARTAERILPLEGALNFRDLGGYDTADGRRVAWGKVYRADELSRLTDDDLALLRDQGIRLICDLRNHAAVQSHPDRLPEGAVYRHLPVFAQNPIGPVRALFIRHKLDATFKTLYRTSIVEAGAPVLGNVLREAANPANLPLVIHCTGGKDRTGVASALLLHVCGVPRETIVADYSLTNLTIEGVLARSRETLGGDPPPGLRIEQMYPLLSARPELIEYAFACMEALCGSVDGYLHGPAMLTDADLDAIRRNLLE